MKLSKASFNGVDGVHPSLSKLKAQAQGRNVFRKKLGLRNFVIFQKEQGQAFQNQTKSMEAIYCEEIPRKTTREIN